MLLNLLPSLLLLPLLQWLPQIQTVQVVYQYHLVRFCHISTHTLMLTSIHVAPSVSSHFLWFTPSTQVLSSAIPWYYSSTAVSSFTFVCSISLTSFCFSHIRSSRVHNIMCSFTFVKEVLIFYSPYTPPIPTQTTINTGKRCSGLALTHRLFREPTRENNDYSITLISTTSVYNHWLGVISLNYSNTLCITQ